TCYFDRDRLESRTERRVARQKVFDELTREALAIGAGEVGPRTVQQAQRADMLVEEAFARVTGADVVRMRLQTGLEIHRRRQAMGMARLVVFQKQPQFGR